MGVGTKTMVINPMPSTTRASLSGETFDVYYKKGLLTITNENYRGAEDGGRKIKATLELNPNLNYTPYISIAEGTGMVF